MLDIFFHINMTKMKQWRYRSELHAFINDMRLLALNAGWFFPHFVVLFIQCNSSRPNTLLCFHLCYQHFFSITSLDVKRTDQAQIYSICQVSWCKYSHCLCFKLPMWHHYVQSWRERRNILPWTAINTIFLPCRKKRCQHVK